MWRLEPRSAAAEGQFVYAGAELLVSRMPEAWLMITGDASISRKHASLHLVHSPADVKRGRAATLELKDLNAKNGTYVRQSSAKRSKDCNVSDLKESHRMQPGSSMQLQHGDVVRFGLYASYRVVYSPMVVATSMLPNNEAVLHDLHLLGAVFSKDWSSRCTHLVMNTIKLSAKVACALASGGFIVTPAFLPALLQALKEKKPILPPAHDFLPAVTEPSIQPSPSLFTPNNNRKSVFRGKNFCFGTEKGHRRLATIIQLAGGECSVLEACHMDVLCSGTTLLLRTVEDTSSPTPVFTAALKALKTAGLHVIPESDIVLAVLYCSTERFCNPNVSQQLLLDRPALHTQTQSSAAVFAVETQDVASSVSTSKSSGCETTSSGSRGRADVIPETPSSSCSGGKAGLANGSVPAPINKRPHNSESSSEAKLSNKREEDCNSKLPNGGKSISCPNGPALSNHESTMSNANVLDRASKKRYRSSENIIEELVAKRSAPSKPGLPDTQDIEMSQDGDDVKEGCSFNLSTFAPPLVSTQIYENELQPNELAKPTADIRPQIQFPSVPSNQKNNTGIPEAISAAQKIVCIPPTPTPPSQVSLLQSPEERNSTIHNQSKNVLPQSHAPLNQHQSKTVPKIFPSLDTMESFPTETLERTTQFCPELQTAPLPSLETPCLDGILTSKSPTPDSNSLGYSSTSRDPFTPLNPNSKQFSKAPGKEVLSKASDVFQLPSATVRRRKVQQRLPESAPSSAINSELGGIKRTRSTVELEEEKERQNLAPAAEVVPARVVSIKEEQPTPSPIVPAHPDAATPTFDGFVSGKRPRLQKSPNKTTTECDERPVTSDAPDAGPVTTDVQNETEVKPPVNEINKNITVCRILMTSLVLRTSILGDDYQPPQQSTSGESTKNFKRFRKVRYGGPAVSLPRIIGGRDLVPHTSIDSNSANNSIPSTANPRSLWLSQHPEVTQLIDQEDREQEEDAAQDQMDSTDNGARSSHNFGRKAPVSRHGSITSYFANTGTSKSTVLGTTQSGVAHGKAPFKSDDFAQYRMPSANVKRRVPRKCT
ncbi:DNA repair Nbs1 C-terminal [Trinorchestia longiramus]|nr:DNA repair Nbs1 C-terminal [Trinorchestia longiramus]